MGMLQTITKLLTFRISRDEMLQFNRSHFIAGLVGTWVAGMGRYWDDSHASFLQHAGLGSVIYVFVLSAFIWMIVGPFLVEKWSYFTVLCFISLTSFPAIFYAIPVERFFTVKAANAMNGWFLLLVASWRLGLLFYFLKKFTRLSGGNIITITLMPICLIIVVLNMLNLHRVVYNFMGGMRNPTPHDSSYMILMFLTTISAILTPILFIAYGIGINNRRGTIERENIAKNTEELT